MGARSIHHVGVAVDDLDEAVASYRRLFGADPQQGRHDVDPIVGLDEPEPQPRQPGKRDGEAAHHFIGDLALRLAGRVQLTSDGHRPYLNAVEESFGADIDFAMLVKIYGDTGAGAGRYSLDYALLRDSPLFAFTHGMWGLLIAVVLGLAGGIGQLAIFYRPPAPMPPG